MFFIFSENSIDLLNELNKKNKENKLKFFLSTAEYKSTSNQLYLTFTLFYEPTQLLSYVRICMGLDFEYILKKQKIKLITNNCLRSCKIMFIQTKKSRQRKKQTVRRYIVGTNKTSTPLTRVYQNKKNHSVPHIIVHWNK